MTDAAVDSALIIPVGQHGVVMVRPLREAHGREFLEFPGGAIEHGESPFEAASRELLEETGIEAITWRALTIIVPSTANSRERCHVYMAADLRTTRDPAPGEAPVVTIPTDEVATRILNEGADAVALAAWYISGLGRME